MYQKRFPCGEEIGAGNSFASSSITIPIWVINFHFACFLKCWCWFLCLFFIIISNPPQLTHSTSFLCINSLVSVVHQRTRRRGLRKKKRASPAQVTLRSSSLSHSKNQFKRHHSNRQWHNHNPNTVPEAMNSSRLHSNRRTISRCLTMTEATWRTKQSRCRACGAKTGRQTDSDSHITIDLLFVVKCVSCWLVIMQEKSRITFSCLRVIYFDLNFFFS